ncbi:YeiH family protein [Caenimonas soli]|uniref:YeiH family protein n=1 Tax=Caenimonas soli TaxID=2735555 RepID=UPI00155396F1|nr:putative sulfate exporter family transporter [Caenimonas soli]NPC57751.1 putative sulfate exporter family transporter [Caenimonas soli]
MNAVVLAGTSVMRRWPGTLVCVLIALAATFVSEHYGGPQLIYALLMGLAFHFLHGNPQVSAGVDFCGRTLLRIGVALLGARITLDQVAHLGWKTAAVVAAGLVLTIACGVLLSRLMRRRLEEGLLSGGAVAICGASAALAISSVLPQTRENERITLLNVVGVTVFSTVAMIAYPFALRFLELNPTQSGIFLGGTIHDVAQVVAAGLLLGPEAADTATVVKLFRVLLLMPVVLMICILVRRRGVADAATGVSRKVPLVPGFLLAFVGLVLLSSTGILPPAAIKLAGDSSRWLLVIAIAAAGVKTSFEDLLKLGWQPIVMLVVETLFIAAFVALAILMLNLGVA